MADFCQQCSVSLFGEDTRDLSGLGDGTPLEPGTGWVALCEGCGPTVVDDEGRCLAEDCLEHHGGSIKAPALNDYEWFKVVPPPGEG